MCLKKKKKNTKQVDIRDVLKWKNMFLLFSCLDISNDDISSLKLVYEATKKEDKYKIVWIPIVKKWNDELRRKFDILRRKMPWHAVNYFEPLAGMRKIKEDWHFNGKPIVVVMNEQGDVKNTDALPLIRKSGMMEFPFHKKNNDKKGLLGRIL